MVRTKERLFASVRGVCLRVVKDAQPVVEAIERSGRGGAACRDGPPPALSAGDAHAARWWFVKPTSGPCAAGQAGGLYRQDHRTVPSCFLVEGDSAGGSRR